MQLASEVESLSGVCERLLNAIALNSALSLEEAQLIQYLSGAKRQD